MYEDVQCRNWSRVAGFELKYSVIDWYGQAKLCFGLSDLWSQISNLSKHFLPMPYTVRRKGFSSVAWTCFQPIAFNSDVCFGLWCHLTKWDYKATSQRECQENSDFGILLVFACHYWKWHHKPEVSSQTDITNFTNYSHANWVHKPKRTPLLNAILVKDSLRNNWWDGEWRGREVMFTFCVFSGILEPYAACQIRLKSLPMSRQFYRAVALLFYLLPA